MNLLASWIVDHIPLWVWITVVVVMVGAAFYFLSPILVPLWNVTPRWVKLVLGFVLSLLAAIAGGRYKGAKDERDMEARRNAEALQTRVKVDHDVDKLTKSETDERLANWYRD